MPTCYHNDAAMSKRKYLPLPEKLHHRVKIFAAHRKMAAARVLEIATEQYLDRPENKKFSKVVVPPKAAKEVARA